MKNKDPQIGFKLQGIKTEQFAIFEENYIPKQKAIVYARIQFKLNQQYKRVGVFLSIEFKQEGKIIIKIVVSCHFKLEESSWESFIHKKESKIIIPKGFMTHLVMITTGTTRGVLFAKTELTQFSKFIVPTLNVTKLVPVDASFDWVDEKVE